tara:strand:- start:3 stop:185 length:183 start_codon:yes stop_codon:yes gene_type:complete
MLDEFFRANEKLELQEKAVKEIMVFKEYREGNWITKEFDLEGTISNLIRALVQGGVIKDE